MEYVALKFIGVGMMAFGMMGAAIGVGMIFSALLTGIARNPAAEGKLSKYVYIGAGLAEAMGLFSLVIALLLIYAV
ncbi:MAG: F0F1 ATP synthase subunit C [Rickettsiales bacterium]|nr:F0F1 ATP synthase subunit C [Rickettsiales bacterium]